MTGAPGSPGFSVLVPTYNQARYLGAALESLLAQTDPDWEAIVINDGSTDATPGIMERYAQQDSRIRSFHRANGGVAAALNDGLRHARGRWVCWLSSDDLFDPRKLEVHREWMTRHPDCSFFFSYFRLLREATGEIVDHELWGPLPAREFQVVGLFYRNYISGISVCINREAWNNVGRFDEQLRYAQDYDMWLRLLSVHPGIFIPEWTCTNRNHAAQGSEVFPQACYYDTAKAAIRFINAHRFEELFPLLDLQSAPAAVQALEQALAVAEEPSGFLYSLGAHPALALRALEWLLEKPREGSTEADLLRVFQARARELGGRHQGTWFGLFWRILFALSRAARRGFSYREITPVAVAELLFYASGDPVPGVQQPLAQYLRQFDQLELEPRHPARTDREVLFLPPGLEEGTQDSEAHVEQTARHLARSGCRVVVLRHGTDGVSIAGGVVFVGIEHQGSLERFVMDCATVDLLVAPTANGSRAWGERDSWRGRVATLPYGPPAEAAAVLIRTVTPASRPCTSAGPRGETRAWPLIVKDFLCRYFLGRSRDSRNKGRT